MNSRQKKSVKVHETHAANFASPLKRQSGLFLALFYGKPIRRAELTVSQYSVLASAQVRRDGPAPRTDETTAGRTEKGFARGAGISARSKSNAWNFTCIASASLASRSAAPRRCATSLRVSLLPSLSLPKRRT